MKRLFALLLAAAAFVGIAGAVRALWNAGPVQAKKYTIDLIVKSTNMEFWKSVNEGAQAAASAYNATVTMTGPAIEKSDSQQVGILEQAITKKPDAIILAAGDYKLLEKPVQKAIDAKIPVVMVDSDVSNSRTVAYVGTDNVKLGTMLAQKLEEGVTRAGEVGVVSFVQQSSPAVQREKGFRSALRSDSRFTLLDTVYSDSDIAKAESQTEELVAQHPGLVAVAALNAEAATGAARALSALARKDIALFAIDCTPEEAMYMEEGVLSSALLQNPFQMGYYSVETACQYLKGKKVTDTFTDIYPVDIRTLFDELNQQLIFPFNS